MAIKNFKTTSNFYDFVEETFNYDLGHGKLGKTILTKNGECLKVLNEYREDNIDKIITSNDYNLNNFIFPNDLYTVDNKLVGYSSNYIKNDLLVRNSNFIESINFNNLVDSYNFLIDDTRVLSKDKICLGDIDYNILFDNNKLYVVDTIDFGIKKCYSQLFKYNWDYNRTNKYIIDNTIKRELSYFTDDHSFNNCSDFKDVKKLVLNKYGTDGILPKKKDFR